MNNFNYQYSFVLLLFLVISCGVSEKEDPCLKSLDIVSKTKIQESKIIYKVVGELRTISKGLNALEHELEKTLGLPDDTFVGCIVFEENFPECFSYYIIDSRLSIDFGEIELHSKVQVELEKVKLNKTVVETIMKQKNVEYLYIVKSINSVE